MRRPHRHWHRRVWLVLPVLLSIVLVAALVLRPASPTGTGPLLNGNIPVQNESTP